MNIDDIVATMRKIQNLPPGPRQMSVGPGGMELLRAIVPIAPATDRPLSYLGVPVVEDDDLLPNEWKMIGQDGKVIREGLF